MRCSGCNQEVPEDQTYVHRGETLCEDCYLEGVHQVKACAPWAVRAATCVRETLGLKGTEDLSALQKAIHEFIKRRGKVTREEIMENFELPQHEMETQFAILRHCELMRAHKEKGTICVTTFEYEQVKG